MRNQKGFTLFELIWAAVVILGIVGWVMNLAKVFSIITCPITLETVLRVIFIFFFPIGAVAGYFPVGNGC